MSGSGTVTIATGSAAVGGGNNLIDLMLELAKMVGIAVEGVATDGSTTTLEDDGFIFSPEEYAGGTIWILSGDNDEECEVILESAGKKFTWETAMGNTIGSGAAYAVATKKFSKKLLKQSINFVLGRLDIIKKNDSLVVIAADEYTLPTGVKNIKRVFVASAASNPYGWVENNNWREIAGLLIFQAGKAPSDTGKIIRLVHLGKHGAIDETGDDNTIDLSVNEDYVLWASAKQLWRSRIATMGKDDPSAYDFFNEAIQETANEAAKGKSIKIHKSVRESGF